MIRPGVGILTGYPHRTLIALARQNDVAFVWLDAEQTGLTPADTAEVVTRLAGSRTDVLVRVPDTQPDTLISYANTGVHEIVLPRVKQLDEVRKARAVTSYPPAGLRPRQVVPGSGYGADWETAPTLSIIVETVECAEQIEAFADSEDLAAIWLGPRDLEDDLIRRRPQASGPLDIKQVVDELVVRATGRRAALGLGASDLTGVHEALACGAVRCSVFWEVFLRNSLRSLVEATTAVATQQQAADSPGSP